MNVSVIPYPVHNHTIALAKTEPSRFKEMAPSVVYMRKRVPVIMIIIMAAIATVLIRFNRGRNLMRFKGGLQSPV